METGAQRDPAVCSASHSSKHQCQGLNLGGDEGDGGSRAQLHRAAGGGNVEGSPIGGLEGGELSRKTFWLIKKTYRFLSKGNKQGQLSPHGTMTRSEGGDRSKLASDTKLQPRQDGRVKIQSRFKCPRRGLTLHQPALFPTLLQCTSHEEASPGLGSWASQGRRTGCPPTRLRHCQPGWPARAGLD